MSRHLLAVVSEPAASGSGASTAVIVGAVVGAVALLTATLATVFLCFGKPPKDHDADDRGSRRASTAKSGLSSSISSQQAGGSQSSPLPSTAAEWAAQSMRPATYQAPQALEAPAVKPLPPMQPAPDMVVAPPAPVGGGQWPTAPRVWQTADGAVSLSVKHLPPCTTGAGSSSHPSPTKPASIQIPAETSGAGPATFGHTTASSYGTRTLTMTNHTANGPDASASALVSRTAGSSGTDTVNRTGMSTGTTVVDMPVSVQGYVLKSLTVRWEDITLGSVLGEGGFGKVFKGRWQGNKVAVKMLNLDKAGPEVRTGLHQEALIMSELRHPCIARVYGLVDDPERQAIIMAYYRRGTLAKARTSIWFTSLSVAERLRLAQQVASGMCFLHERSFVHGDLKASNVLFEDDGPTRRRLVIADFGLATSLGAMESQAAMTVSISPPEVLANPRLPRTAAADVYAFSMLLLELMTGRPAFAGMSAQMVSMSVCGGMRPNIPPLVSGDIVRIIEACWAQDPASRPSFAQLLPMLDAAMREHQQAWGDTTTMFATHTQAGW